MSPGRRLRTGSWQGHPTGWRPGSRRRVRGREGRAGGPSGGRRAAPRDEPPSAPRRGGSGPARSAEPAVALRGGRETRSAGRSGVFRVRLEAVEEVFLHLRGSSSLAICYTLVVEDEFVRMLPL